LNAVTAAIFALTVGLAAANGSNDVSKGVATLAGSGVTRYRTAIAWGTAATLAGSLASLDLAHAMTKLFSKGIVAAHPSPAFALAVVAGAATWVLAATAARLPVSTTHALVGALIGAGLRFSPGTIRWHALVPALVVPLLLSVAVAYGVSLALNLIPGRVPECICVELPARAEAATGAGGSIALFSPTAIAVRPARIQTGTVAACAAHPPGVRRLGVTVNGLHWISSAGVSFARGLNDTPKIVAVGAFALVPAGMSSTAVLWVVALAMAGGALAGGLRVAHRLGDGIVRMSHLEAFKANLTTATLVGLGATRGLPMSTTHVSTGAITGAAGTKSSRLNPRTLRDFLLAWTLTPAAAGLVAAGVYGLVH
jgi:phosphate/sulfate permease